MSRLQLELADSKTKYRPGESLEGVAFWELDNASRSLEVRLFWRTQGKGTVDVEVVQSLPIDGVGARDRRPFRFALPSGPYSVSGSLLSVVWGVEIVTEPSEDSASVEITLSPTGEEVRLTRIDGK